MTKPAAALARKSTAGATSSGVPQRPSGVRSSGGFSSTSAGRHTPHCDERPCAFIEIADDGTGMEAPPDASHHGLVNMRRRAREIGADLAISTGPSGTRVRLSVPFGDPAAA